MGAMKLQEEPHDLSKGTLLRSKALGLCRIKYIHEDVGQVSVIFNHRPHGSTADAYLIYVDGKIYDWAVLGGAEVEIVEN